MRVFVSVALVALLAFLTVATLGVYLSSAAPDHHDAGCPLMVGQATICVGSPLAHLDHWQDVFVAVIVNTFALFAMVILVVTVLPFRLPDKRPIRVRPTLTVRLSFKNFFHKEYFILKRRSVAADLLSIN